jgi:gamma-glutamyltranspeptidase/glutathione hydrolase
MPIGDEVRRRVFLGFTVAMLLMPVTMVSQTVSTSTPTTAATGASVMAATAHPLATEAAISILQKGGNAVDAAVAAAFAIGVVEPDASGLGGGGGMLVSLAGGQRPVYINYYPFASSAVSGITYTGRADAQTGKAILVPGTVAGLTLALERYGTLPLPTVLGPAIRLARDGFPIDGTLAQIILDNVQLMQRDSTTAAVYLHDGFPPMEGDTLRQPDLADVLTAIAAEGRSGFYEGRVARTIVESVQRAGGAMTLEDLRTVGAQINEPLRGTYRGYDVLTAPPPQSGIHVLEALNILENEDLHALGPCATSAESMHLMAETLRRVYADRTSFLADPRFEEVPTEGLSSKAYARSRLDDIDRIIAYPKEYRKTRSGDPAAYQSVGVRKGMRRVPVPADLEHEADDADTVFVTPADTASGDVHDINDAGGGHTTHLCVMDKDGNAVSLTQTLGTFFGSGVTAAGVLLNNAMSNFATTVARNAIRPGKQPRSSISPTILLRDGNPFMAVGSPGATRIVATVVEVIVNVVDHNMSAQDANAAPRFHCQKADDYLHLEGRISASVQESLRQKGHALRVYGDFDLFFGGVQLILRDPVSGVLSGSADPRRGGAAIGY